jgi:hypothetical protein
MATISGIRNLHCIISKPVFVMLWQTMWQHLKNWWSTMCIIITGGLFPFAIILKQILFTWSSQSVKFGFQGILLLDH